MWVCMSSHSAVSDSLWPHGLYSARLLCPWDFPGKNTGVCLVCHFLLHGIFLTKGSNFRLLCLLHFRKILLPLSHQGSPMLVCRTYQSHICFHSQIQKKLLKWLNEEFIDTVRLFSLSHFSMLFNSTTTKFCLVSRISYVSIWQSWAKSWALERIIYFLTLVSLAT